MEQKRKNRKVLRASLTKAANELEDLLSKPEADLRLVQVCINSLQQKVEGLKLADSEIYTLLLEADASEEDLLAEITGCDNYRRKCDILSVRCEEVLKPTSVEARSSVSVDTIASSRQGRRKFKLPVLEFKKFDGNIKDWLPFWSQFKKVHDDPDIDLSDKVEYLIQATVPGTRARQLVGSFPATGNNYIKIVDSLKARFGRDDLQIEVYVRELLKLIVSNATSGNKIELSLLYDRIETQLRALETLGITSDKYASMLFPLIESCFSPDLLRVWQRSTIRVNSQSDQNIDGESSLESRLKSLMLFLKNEVENEQHVSLAVEGFGLGQTRDKDFSRNRNVNRTKNNLGFMPTATGLTNNISETRCVFCNNSHESANCFKAQKFSLEEKRNILSDKGACFRCLKIGHLSRRCRGKLRCVICGKSHVALMCQETLVRKVENEQSCTNADPNQTLTNSTNTHVFLQTLRVKLEGVGCSRFVRALIDTGSQKSYVLKSTARCLGYNPKRQERLLHGLFGGSQMMQQHDCYDIRLRHNNYSCTFEALDQNVICTEVSPVFEGPWMNELAVLNIQLSDVADATPIEVLIGSDVAGRLYTGRRQILPSGLVAIETLLGWTLMGKIPQQKPNTTTMTALSLLVKNASLTDLWELETLGISDPAQQKTREEMALATKDFFSQTLAVDPEGRYEVRLPWIEDHPALPSNYNVAQKRLENTVRKLKNDGLFESYDQVFKEWLKEDIIEEVIEQFPNREAHYLPHRPVIKESNTTTKIRPVFDASAKEKDKPSLNQCLEKGLNLIEEIPNILLKFRIHKIGVIADIRKAFLQISVNEADRNYLRFLWVDAGSHQKVFRHRRVVFGVNSSPFLLGATLEHHLTRMLQKCEPEDTWYSEETILRLLESFYVDNCVTSVPDEEVMQKFVQESSLLMADGKFDLRGWEYTHQVQEKDSYFGTAVLGLIWNTNDDTLSISLENEQLNDLLEKPVTKRLMLSSAQRVFDPIGFTCPASLRPKLLLQQTWEKSLGWDTPVDEKMASDFRSWLRELPYMTSINIPRWICAGSKDADQLTLHTFCDASKNAFSAVVFLRGTRLDGSVFIHLLAAKSRVAPLKKLSIPRLELMAAVIGVRLFNGVKENLKFEAQAFFWTDSSTVLFWIQNKEEWATFVWNRVEEIRRSTSRDSWLHVPGFANPADLPSRGCSAKKLLESRWWEGPSWLYQEPSTWPKDDISLVEEEISQEKRKKLITTLVCNKSQIMTSKDWHLDYFSKYSKSVRMCAWVFRFLYNLKNRKNTRKGQLTSEEFDKAEEFVLRLVQYETFSDEKDKHLSTLNAFKDENGVLRLRSRVSNRNDIDCFRFPIVLPSKHPVISQLIFQEHVKSCHIGIQGLMSVLRETYWILGGRRALKSVVSKCVVCRKQNSKPFDENSPPLPLDRVRDAAPFEVTGVDFAGPLYIKNGEKVWICIFTCAVYRAVHFELCSSLSVAGFIQTLRRFIARRGRPKTIYSDNGTNFAGTENAFSRLDFNKIAECSVVERIKWRFNPPTGPWWGGFWERLIGILKQLLRRILGRASLSYEDLSTLVCDCESIINSRPITFMSSDPNELIPLTPMMFLRDLVESGVPDLDAVDQKTLCRKMRHKQKLREDLRKRFRNEYLGQLQLSQKRRACRQIMVGEVVLIGNDQDKRLNWPVGRVAELIPGKDGKVRLVKLTTAKGQLLRPIQRIYPLECMDLELGGGDPVRPEPVFPESSKSCSERKENPESTGSCKSAVVPSQKGFAKSGVKKSIVPAEKVVVTRSGRRVNLPKRFSDLEFS